MARKRKERKEGVYCMGSTMPFAGAGREGYIQVCYASRGGCCRPVSNAKWTRKVKEGERESNRKTYESRKESPNAVRCESGDMWSRIAS